VIIGFTDEMTGVRDVSQWRGRTSTRLLTPVAALALCERTDAQ